MTDALPAAARPWHRWLRWLALAVGALLLLWAIAWLAVPPILKSQAEQRLSALLGREVTIGRVGFAPWSLELTVEQLRIGTAADASHREPQFSVDRVHVNADLRSVLRLAPVIEAVDVQAPKLRLTRLADGRYDIDDLLARFKRDTPPPADAKPARFALYNLRLVDGAITFDDRPVQREHRLQDLQVALPFLSNLEDHVAVTVEPRLAFTVDGASFDSGAQTKPFAHDRESALDLRIADLDIARWLPYLPAALPVRPSRGRFATELQIQFAMPPGAAPRVSLKGQATLREVALVTGAGTGEPFATWKQLQIGLLDVQPLARRIALGSVILDGAQIELRRAADGSLNVLAAAGPSKTQTAPTTAPPASTASAPAGANTTKASDAWQVSVEQVSLTHARADWRDATTEPAAALRADELELAVQKIRWPFEAPATLKLTGRVGTPDATDPAAFTVQGEASDRAAKASVDLQSLDLRWLAPYVAQALTPAVSGRATLVGTVDWARGDQPRLALTQASASVKDLRLSEAGAPLRKGQAAAPKGAAPALASVAALTLGDSSVDLLARRLVVGSVTVEQPALRLNRNRDGQWDLLAWAKPRESVAVGTTATPASGPEWQLKVGEAHVKGGRLHVNDEHPSVNAAKLGEVVRLVADGVQASVRDLSWPGAGLARTQLQMRLAADADSGAKSPAPVARAAANIGRIEWTGQFAPEPLQARGTLRIDRVPVHLLDPYVRSDLNLELLRAEATWRGDVAVAQRGSGFEVGLRGDALLGDVHVSERVAPNTPGSAAQGEELLSWQSFALQGLQFTMKPGGKPTLDIKEAALSDFYSRLVITEQGSFNLRDVAAAPGTAASAPKAAPAAAASAPAGGGLPIDISIGGTRLVNGKVDFTDRFIRPNFSAALTALNGRLGPFNSSLQDMATLDLRGIAAGTAQLEISGALNPTAKPLALDIRAKATDLELAPLSPYAGRYAGYGIERGKLSVDLAYKIDPDGKLEAKNQVILNQLTFGDKVDSPDATKLPVLLAVALLKDRNGVIDINLPVSGSINDPQFSIFGLVLRIIGNLLAKAVTAPFALLAGGGSEDLSFVGFEPGTATITQSGRATIDKVAQALIDRPSLKMTVTGASDPVSEREASQKAALEARIRAEQRREALRAGTAADAPLPPLTPAARESIVKRVYADTKLPDKPRNVIGMAKDIPAAEMEALLLNATLVSTDTARELALQRGLAVRDALIAKGLPSERLFLAAPKLRASGEDDDAWTPRVQLALGTS
jgi:uncharacterized protein involved in outer membrane biogenesis